MKRKTLSSKVLAQGDEPKPGTEPYLFESYKHKAADEDGDVDIQKLQQRSLVKKGELIAEVRYRKDSFIGKSVKSEEIFPKGSEAYAVDFDPGQVDEDKGKGRYFAKFDGQPFIEDNKIELSKALLFEGNVNLASGEINYDGPVEVTGNIEQGAKVNVGASLKVNGGIFGGNIIVSGTLEVENGITLDTGRMTVGAEIIAQFINNSKITCHGSINVEKSIFGSEIRCGRHVKVSDGEGIICGSTVHSVGNVKAQNIGKAGTDTVLIVGEDMKANHRLEIRKGRLEKINDLEMKISRELGTLNEKSEAQLTKKHKVLLEEYNLKMEKIEALKPRLEFAVEKAEKGAGDQ